MTATVEFRLPDVGEGLTEAQILAWHVAPGDAVALNDILVEIETSKASVELPSPHEGTVVELLAEVGETVAVGTAIITIAGTGTPGPVLVGYGPEQNRVARRPRKAAPAPTEQTGRRVATPMVRKLAGDLGVELADVVASGPAGRITRDDVYKSANGKRNQQDRAPVRGVRKQMADAMVASAFTAPHVTEWVTVDVTKSLKLVRTVRCDETFAGIRLTPLCLVIKAALTAIARHPSINAKWEAGEIVQYADVNIGIATATERGLIVPNIASAPRMSLREIATALNELVDQARAGKTPPDKMRGGTFTITNIGVFGVDGGTPILNPGEAAILCFGQIRRAPWEHNGRVRLRDVTTLAMSFDHRLVDGELGSKVLHDIAAFLEEPTRMLLA